MKRNPGLADIMSPPVCSAIALAQENGEFRFAFADCSKSLVEDSRSLSKKKKPCCFELIPSFLRVLLFVTASSNQILTLLIFGLHVL